VLGPVSLQSGEVGLFAGDDESSRALISYVAWGDGPHLLAEAATATGLWDESNVAVIDDAPSISTGVYPATDAPDWSADIGG
ncbi:MAG: hypothetical protein HKN80_07095, partial [Acidimicrobiia bacterium]|nr:hypothetical protein [Acidimicrobiia bacterium]